MNCATSRTYEHCFDPFRPLRTRASRQTCLTTPHAVSELSYSPIRRQTPSRHPRFFLICYFHSPADRCMLYAMHSKPPNLVASTSCRVPLVYSLVAVHRPASGVHEHPLRFCYVEPQSQTSPHNWARISP